jgi:predicted ATPase/DNA-binding SARP family transcriptional activator
MEFRLLGPVGARADGRSVELRGAKARGLLAMLLLRKGEEVSAERLVLGLWGEDAPPGAVKRLHVLVSRLRKTLGAGAVVETTPVGYRIRVAEGELDADRFERHVGDGAEALAAGRAEEAGDRLREAERLWSGPPLAGLADLPFAPPEIARLEERRLGALDLRIQADLSAGRHAELVPELQALVHAHPLRELLHARLILALYRCGRQADALEAYRRARSLLVGELGVEPGPELQELHAAILAHETTLAAPRSRGRSALPPAVTPLFGRERDIGAVLDLLRAPHTPLVTVIGPGGVGKTRLAIEVAGRAEPVDGTWFVDLAPVDDARDLPSAVAHALGVPAREGEVPEEALARFLRDRAGLLLLDNFEHLSAAAPLIGRLSAACDRLTVLITSRAPTGLAAERVYRVPSLETEAAVAMFCDRARARDPGFRLNGDADHVREICRRLDGLPLALELAAARIGLLVPEELAGRLAGALEVLSGGAADAPERHRGLRATIDWSVRLLTPAQRRAFARMAVFAAAPTVATAEAVTAATLDELHVLVAQQLLLHRAGRLAMPATVREYASELLARDAEREAVHERLAARSLELLRAAAPHLTGGERLVWLERLGGDVPNALAALSWALGSGRPELALELAGELGEYWWRANRWRDGVRRLDAALEAAPGAPAGLRAKALLARARLHGVRRAADDRTDLEAALALHRAAGDDAGAVACLGHLAVAETWAGRSARAHVLADEALEAARASGEEAAIAVALGLGVLVSPRFEDAEPYARAAVGPLAHAGCLFDLALVCNVTGYLALAAGRPGDAVPWLDRGLAAARRLGSPHAVYLVCGNLGLARLFLGDLEFAASAFGDALAVCREAADEELVDETLLGVAALAARRGDLVRAAMLVGAAAAHPTARPSGDEQAIISDLLAEVVARGRDALGAAAWDRAERDGGQLAVEEAIELGLAAAAGAAPSRGRGRGRPTSARR